MKGYRDFYFEVRDKRGALQATFGRLWEAERYAEPYNGWTVSKVSENDYTTNTIVFEFKVYFESDKESIQTRYVVADTEEEAIEKIEKYSDDLVAKGFDRLVWIGGAPTVEIEGVI